jgi:hypothetical protein
VVLDVPLPLRRGGVIDCACFVSLWLTIAHLSVQIFCNYCMSVYLFIFCLNIKMSRVCGAESEKALSPPPKNSETGAQKYL